MNRVISCFISVFAMMFAGTAVHAQSAPPKEPINEFLAVLPDCLATPRTDIHECAIAYAEVVDPSATSEIVLAPGQPPVHASVVKGKYNTCKIYDKRNRWLFGYSCFSNSTGQCVSGDCCSLDDPNC